MKTQYKTLTIIIIMLISIVRVWAQDTIITITASLGQTVNYSICDQEYTQAIVYKPGWANSGIHFWSNNGYGDFWQDSIIITNANDGLWYMMSSQGNVAINIYFVSPPTVHPSMAQDTSFCTTSFSLMLNAGNPHATYQWSTGATTQSITVNTVDTYTVTVTNACGTEIYSKNVTQFNSNAPYLGTDKTFCWGSNTVLDPGSTNVATYQWSTGESTPTIMVDTTGSYWVYLIDGNGCNGRDTIEITTLVPTPEEVCFVEFDTATWKNSINWTSNLPGNAASIDVYKEGSLNVWNFIGTVAVGTTSFIDMNSTPQSNSNSYRIAIVDTCGNESTKSSPHTTITLISSYDPLSNTYGFSWSAYQGLTVADYFLFGIDSNNTVTQIASVTGNIYMYNYVNPNPGFVKYYIGFETPDCDAKTNVIVKSNWVDQDPLVTAIQHFAPISFSIYPNPSHDVIHLTLDNNDFQVEVTNMLGQVVLHEHNTKVLNISSLPQGVYTISIIVDDIKSPKRFIKQ